jgi:ABC-type nitrate/sulfonate/bicarbonate transport system permease component
MRVGPTPPTPFPTLPKGHPEGGEIRERGNAASLPLSAPGRGPGGGVRRHALPLAVLIGLVVIWEAWVRLFNVDPHELPAPSRILGAFRGQGSLYADNTWRTVQETAVGFAVAVLTGLFFAFVIDATPLLRRAIYPLLIGSQTIPIIAIAPLLIIRLGFGLAPKIVIIVLYCFFPIVVSTVDGLRSAEPEMLNLLRAMGASRWQLLRVARVPAALPSIFSGVKIAATYAVTGAVVSEWLGGSKGLGVSMIRAQKSFAPDKVFAAVLIVMLLTLALFLIIDLAARWLMPWYVSARKEYSE